MCVHFILAMSGKWVKSKQAPAWTVWMERKKNRTVGTIFDPFVLRLLTEEMGRWVNFKGQIVYRVLSLFLITNMYNTFALFWLLKFIFSNEHKNFKICFTRLSKCRKKTCHFPFLTQIHIYHTPNPFAWLTPSLTLIPEAATHPVGTHKNKKNLF